MNRLIFILYALIVVTMATVHSCDHTPEIHPDTDQLTKWIHFIDADGRWIEYYSEDPWAQDVALEFATHPDAPVHTPDPLLLCDSLHEINDPFFVNMGIYLDTMIMTPTTGEVNVGGLIDTFIQGGIEILPAPQLRDSLINAWCVLHQVSYDTIDAADRYFYDAMNGKIQFDFYLALVGPSAGENVIPGVYIHFPELLLGVASWIDEYAIGNAFLRTDTLAGWFAKYPSVRTFSSGGLEVMDSIQLHEAIEVLKDSCKMVPDIPVSYASLNGVPGSVEDSTFLDDSNWVVNK